jgi:hypothetical protein
MAEMGRFRRARAAPLRRATPAVILGAMVVFGIAYALLYRSVAAAWPVGIRPGRGGWRW